MTGCPRLNISVVFWGIKFKVSVVAVSFGDWTTVLIRNVTAPSQGKVGFMIPERSSFTWDDGNTIFYLRGPQ